MVEISEQYKREMNNLAQALDDVFNGPVRPKRVCFVLLVAEFNKIENGRVNYISNGERESTVTMLKELLVRFEGQPQQSGRA